MIVMTTSNSMSEKPSASVLSDRRDMAGAARSGPILPTACHLQNGICPAVQQTTARKGMADRTRIPTNRQFRGLSPSPRAAGNALVGLLAPEFGLTRPSHRGLPRQWPHRIGSPGPGFMQSRISLGYSGGAAPDFHRCSLFVGSSDGKNRPPTHVVTGVESIRMTRVVKRPAGGPVGLQPPRSGISLGPIWSLFAPPACSQGRQLCDGPGQP
jgi:hypothetical protein